MSSTLINATPVRDAPVATDSPGNWRHPRLDEITRRRDATTFSDKNVRRIAWNLSALLIMWFVQLLLKSQFTRLYLSWAWYAAQLVPVAQIGTACLPLLRSKDEIADIPLTAGQRKLLGLAPSSVPPTPDTKFSTPPRYSRSPSISGSVGSRASYTSSPLSGRGSPIFRAASSGSPLSRVDSPLLQKSVGNFTRPRTSSVTSNGGSPFAASPSSNLFSDPGSPSPSGGKRASVGLNSKWLYERGRRTSGLH